VGKSWNKSGYQVINRTGPEGIYVQCHSGHTYAERPDSFVYQGKACKVERVESEWREPGERHFRVLTGDSKSFELCYNEQRDEWSVRELG
jgi:hypothetical protein